MHNSRDPLKLRTLIYWHNKKYLFPCLASFRSKVKPVYQKRRRNAACQESFYHPWHSAKFGAPTARWYFKNFCSNPFVPLEVTLAFSDQGPEYYKTIYRRSQDLQYRYGFLPRRRWVFIRLLEDIFYIYVTSLTKPHNLQQLGFPLLDDRWLFLGICRLDRFHCHAAKKK